MQRRVMFKRTNVEREYLFLQSEVGERSPGTFSIPIGELSKHPDIRKITIEFTNGETQTFRMVDLKDDADACGVGGE